MRSIKLFIVSRLAAALRPPQRADNVSIYLIHPNRLNRVYNKINALPIKRSITLSWILFCFLATPAIPQTQAIEWKVEKNFRLLKNASDQEWLKSISLKSQDPESHDLRIKDLQDRWSELPPSHYNKATGTYEKDYLMPSEWRVRLSHTRSKYGSECNWLIGKDQISGPCHDFVPPISFSAHPTNVSVITPEGSKENTLVRIIDKLFIVVGDSWASGEGQPDVLRSSIGDRKPVSKENFPGRDVDWWDTKCHRSLYAWPILTAARYAQNNPQQSVTIISRACSGAKIKELAEKYSEGGPGERHTYVGSTKLLRPQLVQIQNDLCLGSWRNEQCDGPLRQPDYVLLSIGGNDAMFGPLIIESLLKHINLGIEVQNRYREQMRRDIKYLEIEYSRLAERLNSLFPVAPVLMVLYPDPLHLEARSFCGRGTGGGLLVRDDGIKSVDFISNGFEEFFARSLSKHITNEEVVAIWDDIYTRLTGREPLEIRNLSMHNSDVSRIIERNYDYRGLKSIGFELRDRYPNTWNVEETQKYYGPGKSPWEDPSDSNEADARDHDQLPCYRPRGYCVVGTTVTGRWFNTVTDSLDRIGNVSGALHPNIFGQLYYTSKVYPALPGVTTSAPMNWDPDPANPYDSGQNCRRS